MTILARVDMPVRDEFIELTESHVCHTSRGWGHERYTSIPLRQLSSVMFQYDAPLGWLFLGGLAFLIAILATAGGTGGLAIRPAAMIRNISGIVAAVSCLFFLLAMIIYFVGRREALALGSASHKIQLKLTTSNQMQLRLFAQQVEQQQIKALQQSWPENNQHQAEILPAAGVVSEGGDSG